jgi:hypothetical protein
LTPRFERLYRRKYPPDEYRKEIKAMVGVLQQRYGLDARRRGDDVEEGETEPAEPEQVGFRW